MTPYLVRRLSFASLFLLLAGCSTSAPKLAPTPASTADAWSMVLTQVSQDVQAGRHAAADRLLLDFQQTHPAAPESVEAAYYRALFKLDPSNTSGSTHDAIVLIDGMLATPIVNAPLSPRQADAVVLRRIATALDTRPVTVVSSPSSVVSGPAKADDTKTKDEEIAKLRDELTRANAELERIKRRVATPKP